MRSNRKSVRIVAALATGCVVFMFAATARAVLVGATPYVNQLSGATITSFGRVGMPAVVFTDNSGPLALAVDGGLGTYGQSNANKYTSYANNGPTFFSWTLPSGSLYARTFLTSQGASYPFNTASPYQLSVNGTDVAGHSGAGVGGTSPFVITSSSVPRTGNSAQVLFSTLNETAGLGFAIMQEVVAIEDELTRLPIASGSASSILGGYPVSQAFDNQASLGWAATVGTPGETLTVNLTTPGDVGAIWITGVDARSEVFNVSFNGAVTPTVTGVSWSGTVNAAFIKLDTIVSNVTSITLTFTNSPLIGATPAVHYIGEIIPFSITYPVPEPSTLALLGLGAIGLAIKARRRAAV